MELIGALIHWPKVVFLDEPTIGLDVLAAAKLREFLKTFNQKERATIILTSHNMDDIERLCSRVMIIREGQMIYDGSARGLTQKEQRRLRLRLTTAATIEDLARAAGLPQDAISMGPSTEDSAEEDEAAAADGALPTIRMNLQQAQITSVLQGIMAKYEVVDMGIEQQSLEQVIQRLYTEDRATRTPLTSGPSAP